MIQDISKILVGDVEAVKVYVGDVVVYEKGGDNQPNNEIWYTTTDGQIYDSFNPNTSPTDINGNSLSIISNTYSDGKGIVKYSGDLHSIVPSRSGYSFTDGTNNLDTITFPASLKVMYSEYSRGLFYDSLSRPFSEATFKGIETLGRLRGSNGSHIRKLVLPNTLTAINGNYISQDTFDELVIKENDVFYGSNSLIQDKSGNVWATTLNPHPLTTITKVKDFGLNGANLNGIDLSHITEIGESGMASISIEGDTLSLPNVTSLGASALRFLKMNKIECHPISVNSFSFNGFEGKSINTDEEGVVDFTYFNGDLSYGLFQNCHTIKEFRLGDVKSVGTNTFNGCSNAEIYDFSRCTSMIGKKANSLTINANTIIKVPNALLSDFIAGWADVPSDRFVGV